MNHLDQARLEAASDLLRDALAILDEQGLTIAAAYLDGVICLVDAASARDRHLVRG